MAVNLLIFLIAVSLGSYGAVRYVRGGRREELLAFVTVMAGITLWEGGNIIIKGTTSPTAKLLETNVFNAFIVPLNGYSLLWFALAYADVDRRYIRAMGGIAVVQVLAMSITLAVAPEFLYTADGLVYRGPVSVLGVTFQEWPVLDRTLKPTFQALQVSIYLVLLTTAAVLGRYTFRNRSEVPTGQAVVLIGGIGAPLVANALLFVGVVPPELTLTELALGVTAVAFAVAVFRYRLLELAPVGRQQIVETMTDPVVMLDEDDRVVDSNPAARELVGAGTDWRGMDGGQFFAPFPEHIERFGEVTNADTEISVERDDQTRHFYLNISPIRGSGAERRGRLIVLRDITQLKEREQELDLLRQIQSRVLRHNVRNDLTVVKGYSEALANRTGAEYDEIVDTIASTADHLLSVSTKARAAESIIQKDQTPVELDLGSLLKKTVETYSEVHPSVSFALDVPSECFVETVPAMEFALENLVENAAEHNDATEPMVEITVEEASDGTVITVSDNGPGIPSSELEVIEAGEETPLKHGTGVGLWVVQQAIDEGDATIDYETGDEGTTVTIRIPDDSEDAVSQVNDTTPGAIADGGRN